MEKKHILQQWATSLGHEMTRRGSQTIQEAPGTGGPAGYTEAGQASRATGRALDGAVGELVTCGNSEAGAKWTPCPPPPRRARSACPRLLGQRGAPAACGPTSALETPLLFTQISVFSLNPFKLLPWHREPQSFHACDSGGLRETVRERGKEKVYLS